ncbi:MAG: hypothetical protein ACT4PG_02770 [Panacagrimonas sp.]
MNGSFGLANMPTARNSARRKTLIATALDTIAQRDLLVASEAGGGVRKLNPELLGVVDNAVTTGTKTLLGKTSLTASANYQIFFDQRCAVRLSNGHIAVAYTGDGTTKTTNVNFCIVNLFGAVMVPQTVVQSGASRSQVQMVATSTGFVLLWSPGNTAHLAMAVYNNDGSVVTAATTIITDHQASATLLHTAACLMANGDLAVAYDQTSTRHAVLKFFNTAGAQQGSTITLGNADQPKFGNLFCDSNGDAVAVWYRSAATAAVKVARYTTAGAQVGSAVSITTNTAAPFDSVAAKYNSVLASDNSVFLIYAASTHNLVRINPGNTAATTLYLSGQSALYQSALAASNERVYVYLASASNSTINSIIGVYAVSGLPMRPPGVVTHASLINANFRNTGGLAYLMPCNQYGLAVLLGYDDGSGTNTQHTLWLSADFSTTSVSAVVTDTRMGTVVQTPEFGAVLVSSTAAAANVFMQSLIFDRASILGVADVGAATGDAVRVNIQGDFDTTESLPPLYFDRRTATPTGNKGLVSGSRVTLYGFAPGDLP